MKVLFVSSGNSKNFDVAPFIKSQGESLVGRGVEVDYFTVKGKGIFGYLNAAKELKKHIKGKNIDLIHAHYTLSGWAAVLSKPRIPIILSLMGTDAYGEYVGVNKIKFSSRYLIFLTYLIQPFVNAIICKSKHIESFVYLKKKSQVIPNGILLDKINCDKSGFEKELGLNPTKKHVLFLGNKTNRRKNYQLLQSTVDRINSDEISIVAPYPVSHDQVIKHMRSVDVLVVPSLMEGSPNVIKEAMACNCPIVATNVGDIAWLFGDEPGHFITSFEPDDVAEKIRKALEFAQTVGKTNGRKRIIQLGLDSQTVAQRIVAVYRSVLS
ncbi:MAG: glycosyltransferase family 4 protein [Spirochaetaceae bacterium]|nr:glycosyltransferase family 4 protein [Spirochaetaceae bacterium]MCF7947184.1 glycosyltransferase family 4 protein [Spirochaetia bacterium]MCF7950049.1 glycosyltransferase family 4 protein [Spirochaetaceae bacterium]